jgi:restriction endonuclease S subunit
MPAPSESYFLHKGDLVFRSRGYITTAALMTEDEGDVILAAPFLRIRIYDRTLVMPDYLNWYISSKPAQRYFTARQTGTSVNMVTAGELAALPVPVPPLSVQQQIADIAELAEKEFRLETELMQKRKQYTEALLLEQAYREENQKENIHE